MPDLTEIQFGLLQHAVRIARDEQVRRLSTLESRLSREGYEAADISAALTFWAAQERQKGIPLPA